MARLLASREVLPGLRLLTWQVPSLARRVSAGQFVHLLAPRPAGSLLPAIPVAGFDRVGGTLELLASESSPAAELLRSREGDQVRLDGPIGRGFSVDARSRHLLLVCDSSGISRVRALLEEAVTGGRQVTLLLGVGSAAEVMPSWLLPDEAEYAVATLDGSLGHRGEVSDLLLRYEAWADQCFAAGAWSLLERLAVQARGRDTRLGVARLGRRPGRRGSAAVVRRTSWLQVALPHEVGCALGICLGCVVDGADGALRVCREGPAFSAEALAWEGQR